MDDAGFHERLSGIVCLRILSNRRMNSRLRLTALSDAACELLGICSIRSGNRSDSVNDCPDSRAVVAGQYPTPVQQFQMLWAMGGNLWQRTGPEEFSDLLCCSTPCIAQGHGAKIKCNQSVAMEKTGGLYSMVTVLLVLRCPVIARAGCCGWRGLPGVWHRAPDGAANALKES